MRLAVLQAAAVEGDVPGNLARLDAALGDAAARGADLVVSPELFATGYAMDPGAGGADLAERVADLSARHRVAHAWSQPLAATDGPARPSGTSIGAVVADATGAVLGQYRKVHLYGEHERATFTPGQGPPLVVDVAGRRVGVLLCYDVEFPETARAAALAGAEVLVVPTAMDDPHVAAVLLPARALENGLVLAYANHTGGAFCGASVVVGADGRQLAGAAASAEELLVVDVDPAALARARALNPYLAALRTTTYRSWPTQAEPADREPTGPEPTDRQPTGPVDGRTRAGAP